jgi:hypothetical protein
MSCATVSFTSGGGLKFWLEAYSTTTQDTVSFTPKVSAANVCAAIVPKGTGAIVASIPNGLASGGNARGQYAVDLQMQRANAIEISGNSSVIVGGANNRSLGNNCFVGGGTNNRIYDFNQPTIVAGPNNGVVVGGNNNWIASESTASSAEYSVIVGGNTNRIQKGSNSTIVGGASNTINSSGSFIGGGTSNTVSSPSTNNNAVIVGGASNTASAPHSFVGGGQSNTASATHSAIGGGQTNTASNTYAFVGAGINNIASGDRSVVVGGGSISVANDGNKATGTLSFVGGGIKNTASGLASVVVGGGISTGGNTASANYSSVLGGQAVTASGTHSTAVGGTGNTASGTQSFVGGGSQNTAGFLNDTICGGEANTLTGSNNSGYRFIGGGRSNKIQAEQVSYTTICGGFGNTIYFGSSGGFIGGGGVAAFPGGNFLTGTNSVLVGGQANRIGNGGVTSGTYSEYGFLGGGFSNVIDSFSDYSVISGGRSNTIGNSIDYGTIVGGYQAVVSSYGQVAHASGRFTADGDAQAHELIWRREITGTAQTELFLDGASIRAILPGTNSVWKGIINFAAVCTVQGTGTTGVGSVAAIDYSVTIKRIGTSTVLIAANNLSPLDSDGGMGTSTFDISADNTNEALAIKFTPPGTAAADTVIRVVATFRGTQIKY